MFGSEKFGPFEFITAVLTIMTSGVVVAGLIVALRWLTGHHGTSNAGAAQSSGAGDASSPGVRRTWAVTVTVGGIAGSVMALGAASRSAGLALRFASQADIVRLWLYMAAIAFLSLMGAVALVALALRYRLPRLSMTLMWTATVTMVVLSLALDPAGAGLFFLPAEVLLLISAIGLTRNVARVRTG